MKKTEFLNKLTTALALIAIMLSSTMFTSCEEDDLDPTEELGDAKVTLNVKVINGLTNEDLTKQATFNNVAPFIINGTYVSAEADIIGQELTITATVNGETAEATIKIDDVKRGSEITYNAELIIVSGLVTSSVDLDEVTNTYYATFNNLSHDGNHSHDGNNSWYVNKTDYFQPWSITYDVWTKVTNGKFTEGEIFSSLSQANQASIVAGYEALANQAPEKETKTLTGKASAWSYFNIKVVTTTATRIYTITDKVTGKVAAEYEVNVISSTEAQPVEFAIPGYESHYQHGHGHGHGNNPNAGGGISIAE